MAELYPVEETLQQLEGFSPIQRVLLATSGTLQSTLSAYFGVPVNVKVNYQQREPGTARWTRSVELYIEGEDQEQVVCKADSEVVVGPKQAQELITAEKLGIGQIMEHLGIRPSFALLQVGRDSAEFWRLYSLEGGGITYNIRETFPAQLFE